MLSLSLSLSLFVLHSTLLLGALFNGACQGFHHYPSLFFTARKVPSKFTSEFVGMVYGISILAMTASARSPGSSLGMDFTLLVSVIKKISRYMLSEGHVISFKRSSKLTNGELACQLFGELFWPLDSGPNSVLHQFPKVAVPPLVSMPRVKEVQYSLVGRCQPTHHMHNRIGPVTAAQTAQNFIFWIF